MIFLAILAILVPICFVIIQFYDFNSSGWDDNPPKLVAVTAVFTFLGVIVELLAGFCWACHYFWQCFTN